MSCGPCNCEDCQDERVEEEAPIHRPAWQDAEPANEQQIAAWLYHANNYLQVGYGAGNAVENVAKVVATKSNVREENMVRVCAQIEKFIRESSLFIVSSNHATYMAQDAVIQREPNTRGMKPMDALDFVDRKQRAAEIQKAIAKKELEYMTLHPLQNVPDLITGKLEDNHTCTGCGNTKCNKTEKSCWKCGATI